MFGTFSRRDFLKASAVFAGAAAGAGALAGPAFAQQKVGYITSFGFVIDFAPDLNIHSGGHLRNEGYESEVIAGRGSANAIQALVADQAKFTRLGAMEILRAMGSGEVDLVSVATVYQGSSFSLVHSSEAELGSMKDLEGKTIGIMSVGGLSENFLDLMLNSQGVDPASVKREVVGNNPGNFELIKLGRIDGFMSSIGTDLAMEKAGLPFKAISTDDYAPMPGQCYVALRKTIEEEPELVQHFVRAADASVREFLSMDLGALYDRLRAEFDIGNDKEVAVAGMEGFRKLVVSSGEENVMRNLPESWTSGAESIVRGGLGKPVDVARAYTNQFVDAL